PAATALWAKHAEDGVLVQMDLGSASVPAAQAPADPLPAAPVVGGVVPQQTLATPNANNLLPVIPTWSLFRYAHRHKPTVRGSRSAVLVGPAGEQVTVDRSGRVKVQFHWDRQGKTDDASAWIRAAQSWAGKHWGRIFVPRLGQEVLVNLLAGRP